MSKLWRKPMETRTNQKRSSNLMLIGAAVIGAGAVGMPTSARADGLFGALQLLGAVATVAGNVVAPKAQASSRPAIGNSDYSYVTIGNKQYCRHSFSTRGLFGYTPVSQDLPASECVSAGVPSPSQAARVAPVAAGYSPASAGLHAHHIGHRKPAKSQVLAAN